MLKEIKQMFREKKKSNQTFMRIDRATLNEIASLGQPIKTKQGHNLESYQDVIKRLLHDPKIKAGMLAEREELLG